MSFVLIALAYAGCAAPTKPAAGGDSTKLETYRSADGRLSLSYPASWILSNVSHDYLRLDSREPTEAEIAERDRTEDYSFHDDEYYLEMYIGDTEAASIDEILKTDCRAEGTTVEVYSCKKETINGRLFAVILQLHSNDSACKCWNVSTIVGPKRYSFVGGAGPDFPHTEEAVRAIEEIIRTIHIRA